MLCPVPVYRVPEVWEKVEPYLEKSFGKSPIPIPEGKVFTAVLNDEMKLFLLVEGNKIKGATIFRVEDHLGTPILNAFALSHDPDYTEFVKDLGQLDEIAKVLGCEYVLGYGRRGYSRTLIPEGFKHMQTVMVRKVGD